MLAGGFCGGAPSAGRACDCSCKVRAASNHICVCVRVCPQAAIRKELNEFKSREMEVHEDSKHFTRYLNSR